MAGGPPAGRGVSRHARSPALSAAGSRRRSATARALSTATTSSAPARRACAGSAPTISTSTRPTGPTRTSPIEETLEALDRLVEDGKVRYVGCSNQGCYGLTESLWKAEKLGTARYETIQNNYSLLNRRFEDELAAACRAQQVSLLPYSPLAGGVLAAKYQGGVWPPAARFSFYREFGPRTKVMTARFVNEQTPRRDGALRRAGEGVRDVAASPSRSPGPSPATSSARPWWAPPRRSSSKRPSPQREVSLPPEALAKVDAISREIRYPMADAGPASLRRLCAARRRRLREPRRLRGRRHRDGGARGPRPGRDRPRGHPGTDAGDDDELRRRRRRAPRGPRGRGRASTSSWPTRATATAWSRRRSWARRAPPACPVAPGLSGVAPEAEPAPPFELVDQDGAPRSLASLRGKTVLLDFIYANCPGPCPILTGTHVRVQKLLPEALRARRLVRLGDPRPRARRPRGAARLRQGARRGLRELVVPQRAEAAPWRT